MNKFTKKILGKTLGRLAGLALTAFTLQQTRAQNPAPVNPLVTGMSAPQEGFATVSLSWQPGTNANATVEMIDQYGITASGSTNYVSPAEISDAFLWCPVDGGFDTATTLPLPSGRTSYLFFREAVDGWYYPYATPPLTVIVPPDGSPGLVSGLTNCANASVSATDSTASFEWNADPAATGYLFWWMPANSSNTAWTSWTNAPVGGTNITVWLPPGRLYAAFVDGTNAIDASTHTGAAILTGIAANVPPPGLVSGLTNCANVCQSPTVSALSYRWNALQNSTNYLINWMQKSANSAVWPGWTNALMTELGESADATSVTLSFTPGYMAAVFVNGVGSGGTSPNTAYTTIIESVASSSHASESLGTRGTAGSVVPFAPRAMESIGAPPDPARQRKIHAAGMLW